jgi:hypothetical protein
MPLIFELFDYNPYWLSFIFTFHCIMYDVIMKRLISYWLGFTFTFHFNVIKQLQSFVSVNTSFAVFVFTKRFIIFDRRYLWWYAANKLKNWMTKTSGKLLQSHLWKRLHIWDAMRKYCVVFVVMYEIQGFIVGFSLSRISIF